MCSVESLSWHTAASQEIIDVDDICPNELTPININNNNPNNRNGFVSDNFEKNNFIHSNVGKITPNIKCANGCIRWTRGERANSRRCIQLKIPWIIVLISAIQIVVHYVGCDDTINLLIFTPTRKHEFWRYFSYDFLHSGPVHLYSNVVLQILVATLLETEQGHFRVLIIYFGGILFGALGSAIVNPKQGVVGASAGVYSLLISHISHGILNWSTLSHQILRIIAVFVMSCSDIIFVCWSGFYQNNKSMPKISLAAHGCGALAGLLFGFAVFHRNKECSGRFNYYRLISIILLVCIIGIMTYLLFA